MPTCDRQMTGTPISSRRGIIAGRLRVVQQQDVRGANALCHELGVGVA